MDSLKNNIVFQAINSKEKCLKFFENINSENLRVSYTPKIEPTAIEENYNKFYGNGKSKKNLCQRKIYAVSRAFYHGILLNIIKILKITVFVLSNVKFIIFNCKKDSFFKKKVQIEIYRVGLNVILSLGHLYSLINDKKGRIILDTIALEKEAYDYQEAVFGWNYNTSSLVYQMLKNYLSDDHFDEEEFNNFVITVLKKTKKTYRLNNKSSLSVDKKFLEVVIKIIFDRFSKEEKSFNLCFTLIDQISKHQDWNDYNEVKYGLIGTVVNVMVYGFSQIEDGQFLAKISQHIYKIIDDFSYSNNKIQLFSKYNKVIYDKNNHEIISSIYKEIVNKISYVRAITERQLLQNRENEAFYIDFFVKNPDSLNKIDSFHREIQDEQIKKVLSTVFEKEPKAFESFLDYFLQISGDRFYILGIPEKLSICQQFIHEEAMKHPEKLFVYYVKFFDAARILPISIRTCKPAKEIAEDLCQQTELSIEKYLGNLKIKYEEQSSIEDDFLRKPNSSVHHVNPSNLIDFYLTPKRLNPLKIFLKTKREVEIKLKDLKIFYRSLPLDYQQMVITFLFCLNAVKMQTKKPVPKPVQSIIIKKTGENLYYSLNF